LENGDTLTRAEFERRYEAMPYLKKAELIERVVYVPSPVRHSYHGHQHAHLINWLGHYEAHTPGVEVSDNVTVRLDLDNEPQPDALLFIDPACSGHALIDADGYIEGAPELVAEVASSSVSYDLHAKLRVYRRNGVREYIVCAYWIRRSIGSSCAPDSMSVYLWIPKDFTAARASQVCGSTQQRSYAVTWRPCSLSSSAGLPVLSTPLLPHGFAHRLRRHNTTKVHVCNNVKYTPYNAR